MSDKRFFCIRGFMKSGTNWLGCLLNRHPQVSSTGEFHWQEVLDPILRREHHGPLFRHAELFELTVHSLRDAFRKVIVAANDPAAVLVGDRTPHSLSPLIVPEAWHISIVRDGRDVLVSRAFHLYNNPHVTRLFNRNPALRAQLREFQQNPWFFRDAPELLLAHEELVRDSARWWREHLESDRQTVASHPSLKVRFVRYEELHADTASVCDQLFEFLEVDPSLAAPVEGQAAPGFDAERPNSFFRKGVVGDWKNYFRQQSRDWFVAEAGEELERQGYAPLSSDWGL